MATGIVDGSTLYLYIFNVASPFIKLKNVANVALISSSLTEKAFQKKLTHKERKKLKQQQQYDETMEMMLKKGGGGTSALGENFTISQAEKSSKQLEQQENAVDIKVFT